MIPEPEITRLYLSAINAAALGNCGQARMGLHYLLSGWQRISRLSPTDHPWAGQLEQDWRRVMDAYCAQNSLRHGIEDDHDDENSHSEVSTSPLL